jgi:outer membrane lipoprotein-sorting protein
MVPFCSYLAGGSTTRCVFKVICTRSKMRYAYCNEMSRHWIFIFFLFGMVQAKSASSVPQTNSLVATWLAKQPIIQTWSADFLQTRALKSLTQPLTATGHVWFAEPNRFRWELGKPARTIAVRATDEMLVIYPLLKRVERFPLTGNQTGQWRDALALLETGFPRSQAEMESHFRILSQTATNQICELTLQPRSASARQMMPQLKIAFDTNDFSLKSTELQFADGSTMRNDFTNATLNPKLDLQIFSPKLDPDFKIVEPLKTQH